MRKKKEKGKKRERERERKNERERERKREKKKEKVRKRQKEREERERERKREKERERERKREKERREKERERETKREKKREGEGERERKREREEEKEREKEKESEKKEKKGAQAILAQGHFCSNGALLARATVDFVWCAAPSINLGSPLFVRTGHTSHGSQVEVSGHTVRMGPNHSWTPPAFDAVASFGTAAASACSEGATSAITRFSSASAGEVFRAPSIPRPECEGRRNASPSWRPLCRRWKVWRDQRWRWCGRPISVR